MVGGAAVLYCYHKSLHDRHLSQSILTGVFREKLRKTQETNKNRGISFSALGASYPCNRPRKI